MNSAKMGRMIKWLAQASESSKHYKQLASDEVAYEYVVSTQIPPAIVEDFEWAKSRCPQRGPDSLESQTLRHMKKMKSYRPVKQHT